MKKVGCALLLIAFSLVLFPNDRRENQQILSHSQLQSIIEFLASDQLEGRAPGTRGGEITELYLQSLFKLFGLQPGAAGHYLQPFLLKGFSTRDIKLQTNRQTCLYLEDTMGSYTSDQENFFLEGEAVFAGFGIKADSWKWNDYREPVNDKILIIRANDPGLFLPQLFEGRALTHYGRWSYKMEEAARQGAKAVLLIHTDETAGYNWQVVQNSWAGESLYLPESLNNNLKFRGWIREDSLRKILSDEHIDLDQLYQRSLQTGFKPIPLGFQIDITGKNSQREIQTNNVVAEIPGQTDRKIVLSAHIDHLGQNLDLTGDKIFNGAIDNASAVTALILAAKTIKASVSGGYTLTFLACQAEEAGLLGSTYYIQQADKGKIVLNINFESTPVWEKSHSLFAEGARFLNIEETIKAVARQAGLAYSYFSMNDRGFYFRSDQFPFARSRIPAIWLSAGEDFVNGKNHLYEFFTGNYHTVKDEYDPKWELESLRQTVAITVSLITELNRSGLVPAWKNNITLPFSFHQ